MGRSDPQVNHRITHSLKVKLERSARSHSRSVTAEVNHRLEESFKDTRPNPHHNATRPTVLLLVGPTGIGKTTLVAEIAHQLGDRMVVASPRLYGEHLSANIQWESTDCVAIDEVGQWSEISLQNNIADMEWRAFQGGKTLLLVLQNEDQIPRAGIRLQTIPGIMRMRSQQDAPRFSYEGQELSFHDQLAP